MNDKELIIFPIYSAQTESEWLAGLAALRSDGWDILSTIGRDEDQSLSYIMERAK